MPVGEIEAPDRQRPLTLARGAGLPGVTPADLSVLLDELRRAGG